MALDVKFVADSGAQPPTDIVLSPDGGDVSLEAVPEGSGKDKNWVKWTSASRSFSIKFSPIDEPCSRGRKKFGNENDCWNDSQHVGGSRSIRSG